MRCIRAPARLDAVRGARVAGVGAIVVFCAALCGVLLVAEPIAGAGTVEARAAGAGAAEAPARAQQVPRFERSYRYAGAKAGKKAIEEAVEEAVKRMNPLIRGIARRRMLEANKIIPELGFHLGGDTLVASYVGGRIIEAPADGTSVPWTDQFGDTIRVSHRLRGSTLDQTMAGAKGDRRNRYRFSADGTMTMSVEIRSSRLPEPLRYQVSYRRIE
jgi:hypothetical protein